MAIKLYEDDMENFKMFGISEDSIILLKIKLNEKHRFYHNESHIEDLLNLIEAYVPRNLEENLTSRDRRVLKMVAYFHDAIYDPRNIMYEKSNELLSKEFFESICIPDNKNRDEIEEVCTIILDTKTHTPSTKLSKIFCDFDLYGLKYGTVERLLKDEYNIFKEFQLFDYSDYKENRILFLESYRSKINNDVNINILIGLLKQRKPKIGVYAGSFNPLHIGHVNIIEKAEKIFDKIIIAKGYNPEKESTNLVCDSPHFHKKKLEQIFPFRQTEAYRSILTDFLKEKSKHADVYLIRGLRNGHDLDHEVNQLRVFEDMDENLKVIFIHCDKEYEYISSSMIRSVEKSKPGLAKELGYLPKVIGK